MILDLEDVDADDGPALARLVSELRARAAALRAQGDVLVLRHCPQLLAHTLYKAGVLERGELELELETVRNEEPYG